MPRDRGVKRSTTKAYGSRKQSRQAQLKSAREKQQKSTNIASVVVSESYTESGEIEVCAGAGDQQAGNVGAVIQPPIASSSKVGAVVVEPAIASSSKRKFDLMNKESDDESGDDDGEPHPPVTDDSCLFVQVATLKKLVRNLPCPVCQGDLTVVVIDKHKGPVVGFRTVCTVCENVCSETLSSERIGNRPSRAPFATTRRMVAGTMDTGVGFSGLRRLCWWLDSPCIHQKTYVRHQKEVAVAVVDTVTTCLNAAAVCVRQAYADLSPDLAPENVRDIYVSYDASWMTRGHKSYYGYGSVIDLITHLVIDYEVLSLYCHGCTTVGDHMDKASADYATWKASHVCNKNFEGTPGGMDAAIAEVLWRRSERRHGFRYVTVLSDGDAKTFNHLVSLNVYGEDCTITKEECINHVSKRLGTALRKVAAEGRQEGVVTGGRGYGKLTAATITKLTKYYGSAIRSHPGDLDAMMNAVFATFLHALSTDEDPHHDRCPSGISSWCFYRRAVAKGEQPGPHKDNVGTPLSREVGQFVKPIYVRLGDENLLRRCLRGKTQNPNESVHSVLWRKCLKTDFVGKLRVEAGAAMAVSEFNQGSEKTVKETTASLGFRHGKALVKLTQAKDKERLALMRRKADAQERKNREHRRLHRIRQQDMLAQAEGGASYGAGEF